MKARGQITITDLNDAKTANMFLSSSEALTQVYSKDGATYVPNFASKALVITPELYVSGSGNNIIGQMSNIQWTINGMSPSAFGGATVGTSAPWALTINKNMVNETQWHIVCQGTWTDNGMENTIKADITFAKVVNSGTLAFAQIVGGAIINQNNKSVTLTAQLIRGGQAVPDTTDVGYQWLKLDAGSFKPITGATSSTLKVTADEVTNINSYKVEITDKDVTSGTANQKFTSGQFDVIDMTDPISVRMDTTNGTTLVNGQGSTTIIATLLQDGDEITPPSSTTYKWSGTDKNGSAIAADKITAALAKDSGGKTLPNQLVVTKALVDKKSTFTCDVTI